MTTLWVSNFLEDTIPLGSDSNNGSQATPYLTLSKALSVWANGDTINMHGNETAVATNPQLLDYFNFARAGTVQSWTTAGLGVANAFTLQATGGAARVINFGTAAASGNTKLIGFIVNARSTQTSVITSSSGAAAFVQDCTLSNPAGAQHYLDSNAAGNPTFTRVTLSGAATTAGIAISAMGATKVVTIDGVYGGVTGITASNGGTIVLTAAATGASARIENCNGLSATSNGSGSKCGVIHLLGVTGLIQNNHGMSVNEVVANTGSGIILVDPVAGVQADGGRIIGNTGMNNTSGGYLQRIGTDGSTANDNLTNNWYSSLNDYTGNPAASIMHGFMFGSCVGGLSIRDTARSVSIPLLTKLQTTGAQFISSIVENPVGTTAVFYSKGSVGAKCINAQIRLPRGYGGYVCEIADDPTIPTHSTGTVFSDCNILSDDPTGVSLALIVGASNTGTFANNNWSFAAVTGTPWSYQGVTYATLALWAAAQEPSARNIDPTNLNKAFHRESYRQYAASKFATTEPWLPLAVGL